MLVHSLLDDAVADSADAHAVRDATGVWSYGEVSSWSHAVDTWLSAAGVDVDEASLSPILGRGDEVAIVGRNAEKGAAFLDAAERLGAAGRAHFVLADLSLVAETKRRAIDEIGTLFPKVDALVLCARHYRTTRSVTGEGFESTFALFYLSRFVMSYGMADLLDAADEPMILNVCGPAPIRERSAGTTSASRGTTTARTR